MTIQKRTEVERVIGWVDERTGAAELTRTVLRKVFPDHWSFLLGEIALFAYVVLVATGVFLTFFFTADTRPVIYDGPYVPLRGAEVSAAWEQIRRDNPHIKYHSARRGYVACTATPASMRADFRVLDKVTIRDLPVKTGGSLVVEAGRPGSVAD